MPVIVDVFLALIGGIGSMGVVVVIIGTAIDAKAGSKVTATKRVKKIVRVKVRSIKTPAIRERLVANRAIVVAMNEMQAANDRKREDKKQSRYEAMERWQKQAQEILGERLLEIEEKKPEKKSEPAKVKKAKAANVRIVTDDEWILRMKDGIPYTYLDYKA